MNNEKIAGHPLYEKINDIKTLRIFMQYHVFAVWDFMSLLKSLQKHLTCVSLPWNPVAIDPQLTRLINEIVVGEESDLDYQGNPMSHYQMYLNAMEEINADTSEMKQFSTDLDFTKLNKAKSEFVSFNLDLAMNGSALEVLAAFFFGRENLIPVMFQSILDKLSQQNAMTPQLKYYLERHIELDGDEHGPMAEKALQIMAKTNEDRKRVQEVANRSLELRYKLWDAVLQEIDSKRVVQQQV